MKKEKEIRQKRVRFDFFSLVNFVSVYQVYARLHGNLRYVLISRYIVYDSIQNFNITFLG